MTQAILGFLDSDNKRDWKLPYLLFVDIFEVQGLTITNRISKERGAEMGNNILQ
jgi:hypothetical protein